MGPPQRILSLAQGMSVPLAASAAGMGERTAYKRLEDQDVQDRINELRQELFKEAVRQLAASCSQATDHPPAPPERRQ